MPVVRTLFRSRITTRPPAARPACGRGIDRGRHPEVCRRRAGWQNRQASKGGPWGEGDGWVRRCLTHSRYILKAMLELARRDGVISSNATTGLRKPPDGKKDRALTAEEIAALGKVMREDPLPASRAAMAATKFVLLSGFRHMEGTGPRMQPRRPAESACPSWSQASAHIRGPRRANCAPWRELHQICGKAVATGSSSTIWLCVHLLIARRKRRIEVASGPDAAVRRPGPT